MKYNGLDAINNKNLLPLCSKGKSLQSGLDSRKAPLCSLQRVSSYRVLSCLFTVSLPSDGWTLRVFLLLISLGPSFSPSLDMSYSFKPHRHIWKMGMQNENWERRDTIQSIAKVECREQTWNLNPFNVAIYFDCATLSLCLKFKTGKRQIA